MADRLVIRRRYCVVALLMAALALAIAGQRTWAQVGPISVTGAKASGQLIPTLTWAFAALTLVLLVVGPRGTRLVGVAAMLVGAIAVISGWAAWFPAADLPPDTRRAVDESNWRYLLIGSGVVAALAGAGLIAAAGRARGWTRGRYQRDPAVVEQDPWRAMDAGEDPTADR